MGLTLLAVSLMLRKRLDLDFSHRQPSTIYSLAGFLLSLVIEGFLVFERSEELFAASYFGTAFGWLMLIVALLGASGAFRGDGKGPSDLAAEEYMAQREEEIRQEIRERFAEKDREQS
jgi:uncharacterized membrane protein YedE/YeeE